MLDGLEYVVGCALIAIFLGGMFASVLVLLLLRVMGVL
jgi:hypothetical protein